LSLALSWAVYSQNSYKLDLLQLLIHFNYNGRKVKAMDSCFRIRVCSGFTLIELMITVSILGILLGIGLPSFVTFINNNKITAEANSLIYSFHMARSEAIKRGTDVQVSLAFINDRSWPSGWKVLADTNGKHGYIDFRDILMQRDPPDNPKMVRYVYFNARGALARLSNKPFVVTLRPADCDNIASRIISIAPSGRVNIEHGDCS
jgi:type IV fimbrial biogenesis protein FimT